MPPLSSRDQHARTNGTYVLRTPLPLDAEEQSAAVRASLTDLSEYMAWAVPDYGPGHAAEWINGEHDPSEVPLIFTDPNAAPGQQVLGALGLAQFDWANGTAELGYWIRSDRTGGGLAVQAAVMACDLAFEELGLHRVEMLILERNTKSRRVAEKLGAVHEGRRRQRIVYDGRYEDCDAYSVVASEWSVGSRKLSL